MRRAALALASIATLTGCDHSLPPTATLDRGQGPVSEGAPTRLTHNRVTVSGYAVDGRAIIIRRPDSPAVLRPVGTRYLPRQDASEACVAILPPEGGSATWQYCNRSAGRGDSINNILDAALAPDGRVLFTEFTGAPGWSAAPVRWQLDLRIVDTADFASARTILPLYRDRIGIPVVPADSINWLSGIRWVGRDRFVATGGHVKPDIHLEIAWKGVVVGTIGEGTATFRRLGSITAPTRYAVTSAGTLLTVDVGGLRVIDLAADRTLAAAPLPDGSPEAVGCTAAECWVVTRSLDGTEWQTWSVDPRTAGPTAARTTPVTVEGTLFLSPAGRDAIVQGEAALFRIEGLIAP